VTTTYKPEPSAEQIGEPLATDADTAHSHAGACALCRRPVLRGDRYALLVPDGTAAHLPCVALMASRPRRAVPVIR
jgi:hypothetical protein